MQQGSGSRVCSLVFCPVQPRPLSPPRHSGPPRISEKRLYKPGDGAYTCCSDMIFTEVAMTRFLLLLCAAFLLAGCGAKGVTVVDESSFVTMSQRMTKEMQARGLLTDNASYISLPGGGGEKYGEILFRQLSPDFLFNDKGHVYLGSTFAATRTPSSHATVRKTGFTIVHPTQTVNLSMLGIVDWNGDDKDEWMIACEVRPHLGSESRTYYVLVPPPLRKGEPLQGTIAAVYECYGLACSLSVRDSRIIPRVGEDALPPTDVHDALPGTETVTEPPKAGNASGSGLQERSL